MKRVLVIEAGLKPSWTKKTADMITEHLLASGVFECDRVTLREEQIAACKGCALCLERGEGMCKHHDDAAGTVLEKMLRADGIITVTPNYSLQVPGLLKTLYDRLAFVFHRPRLFGKVSLAVVVQGVYGGKKIVGYIDELMSFWGCSIVKGAVVSGALYPNSKLADTVRHKNNDIITSATNKFIHTIMSYRERKPSFFRLAIFRMTRSSMKYSQEALDADKKYYSDMGWMESKYYTGVKLGMIKSVFGVLIDKMIRNMIRKSNNDLNGGNR